MKELEVQTHLPSQNKVELNVKKKQEIEYILEGSIQPKNGQKVWEINQESGEIKQAEYRRDTTVYQLGQKSELKKMVINPDCVYIPALNAENAKKKYLKNTDQKAYFKKPAILDLLKF